MQIKTKIQGKRVKGIVFARESGPSFGHFNIVIEKRVLTRSTPSRSAHEFQYDTYPLNTTVV